MSFTRTPNRNKSLYAREARADAQRTAAIIFGIIFAAAFGLIAFIVLRPGI